MKLKIHSFMSQPDLKSSVEEVYHLKTRRDKLPQKTLEYEILDYQLLFLYEYCCGITFGEPSIAREFKKIGIRK